MRAFLLSIVLLLGVALSAAYLFDDLAGSSSQSVYTSQNVRL
jgi:hypothetical protein